LVHCADREPGFPNQALTVASSKRCHRQMPVFGRGSTTYRSVRSSSPRYVVKALLENLHQIGITHRNRGSILHEALKHRASDDVLEYLLQTMIQYQESLVFKSPHQYKIPLVLDPAQFRHNSVQSSRLVRGPSLLCAG
jgi:hypothetical protein